MKYLVILFLIFSDVSIAQTFENIVVTCNTCHGEKGISNNSLWPNLAGQKKEYFIKQLKDFRSDQRQDPIMSPQTKNLSDSDIEKLAEYFSNLKETK